MEHCPEYYVYNQWRQVPPSETLRNIPYPSLSYAFKELVNCFAKASHAIAYREVINQDDITDRG